MLTVSPNNPDTVGSSWLQATKLETPGAKPFVTSMGIKSKVCVREGQIQDGAFCTLQIALVVIEHRSRAFFECCTS